VKTIFFSVPSSPEERVFFPEDRQKKRQKNTLLKLFALSIVMDKKF